MVKISKLKRAEDMAQVVVPAKHSIEFPKLPFEGMG
jgi:hypothetical protein